MVQHLVIEAVRGQGITLITRLHPESPVLSQALRAQHQDILVELLVVLDDGECFKCLPQADAVSNNAAVVLFQLTNRPDDGVLLEIVELAPYHRIEKAGVFTWIVVPGLLKETPEDVVQGQEINELGGVVCVHRLHLLDDLLGDVTRCLIIRPYGLKLRHQELNLCLGLIPRKVSNHRQRVRTARDSQPLQGESSTLPRKKVRTHCSTFDDITRRILEHILTPHGA